MNRRRKALTTAHVIASVGLLGCESSLLALASIGATTADATLRHSVYELVRLLVFTTGIPLTLAALGTGVVLARVTRWGVFRYAWVTAKLGLLLTLPVVGIAAIGPWAEEAIDATSAGRTAGTAGLGLIGAAAWGVVALSTATAFSIFRPRWRLRGPSRRSRPERAGSAQG